MSGSELAAYFALLCGGVAYILPVVKLSKHRSAVPRILLAIPVLSLASWWAAEFYYLGPAKLGFTFYGAFFVALASSIAFFALARFRAVAKLPQSVQLCVVLLLSVAIGVGLRVALPGIPE